MCSDCSHSLDLHNTPFGSAGKSFFIDNNGELQHVGFSPDTTGCNATNCTQANTADGLTYRTFIGINDRLPGPTLVVYKGQTLVIDVVNMLRNEATTIHWHGLSQLNAPWMDGAGMISQCPIQPGTSFRYILKPMQAGTFWYHSHSGFQRGDGMAGGLVIKEHSNAERYPIDHIDLPEQHTVMLLDWQREDATTQHWKDLSKLRRNVLYNVSYDSVPMPGDFVFGTAGVDGSGIGLHRFWSGLINGLGKHPDLDFKNSRLKVFSVQQGMTYRFRLVGSMTLFAYRFSIDGHRMTVIATDGYYIQPVVTDYVILHSGERYDVLVTANQTGQPDFWMRAQTLEAVVNFFTMPIPLPPYEPLAGHEALAIMHYEGNDVPQSPQYASIAEIPKTCTEESPCVAVNCPFRDYHPSFNITCVNAHQLRLLYPTPPDQLPSAEYDEEYFFNFAFEGARRLSSINRRTFLPPKISPQVFPNRLDNNSLCTPDDTCHKGCFCTNKVDIPFNKTIRLVFSSVGLKMNNRRFAHPIHLHGHHFHVVAVGYGTYNETTGESIGTTEDMECEPGSNTRICINPTWKDGFQPEVNLDEHTIRKDTIILPGLSYIVVHFKSTNPGMWLLHCHMLIHTSEGMVVIINEAGERHPPPPEGFCDHGNFTWSVEDFNRALQFEYMPPTNGTTATPATTMKDDDDDDDDDGGLSADAVAGIAVGVAVFVALCIALVLVVAIVCLARGVVGKGKKETGGKGKVREEAATGAEETEMTESQVTE